MTLPNFRRHSLVALTVLAALTATGVHAASPSQTLEGTLVSGGGIDDLSVNIRTTDGKEVWVLCDRHCGDWFEETGEPDVQRLKRVYRGKRIVVIVRNERNNGRIAGPSDDDELVFLKTYRLSKTISPSR